MAFTIEQLPHRVSRAVKFFWKTRSAQAQKQKKSGTTDQGARGAVTGGAQMNGFIDLITDIIVDSGVKKSCVFHKASLELPGYYRPEKKWDLLVVKNGKLILALEAKSQIGPSFGNNFNNRTEEAIGSAHDLWVAFREGAFNGGCQPWLGYIFLLEDCEESNKPVKVSEPHFKVFPEFVGASYARRYEILCRKLVLERHYTASAFMMSSKATGKNGQYCEPSDDLRIERFVKSMMAHVSSFADGK
jgi:hypothetical protein